MRSVSLSPSMSNCIFAGRPLQKHLENVKLCSSSSQVWILKSLLYANHGLTAFNVTNHG